jgi:hypothetical protein
VRKNLGLDWASVEAVVFLFVPKTRFLDGVLGTLGDALGKENYFVALPMIGDIIARVRDHREQLYTFHKVEKGEEGTKENNGKRHASGGVSKIR